MTGFVVKIAKKFRRGYLGAQLPITDRWRIKGICTVEWRQKMRKSMSYDKRAQQHLAFLSSLIWYASCAFPLPLLPPMTPYVHG